MTVVIKEALVGQLEVQVSEALRQLVGRPVQRIVSVPVDRFGADFIAQLEDCLHDAETASALALEAYRAQYSPESHRTLVVADNEVFRLQAAIRDAKDGPKETAIRRLVRRHAWESGAEYAESIADPVEGQFGAALQ